MTPKIPLRRCRRCIHYRRETCNLQDLDPCNYERLDGRRPSRFQARAEWYVAVIFFGTLIAAAILFGGCSPAPADTDGPDARQSAVALLLQQHRGELTPWEELQLAIICTESRFNPDALGEAGDRGLYQITPVYVEEVNRVAGTDWVPDDAYDPDKAVQIFAAMQAHYNPTRDRDLAIYYHNKSAAYRRAVLANLETIRRYEAARKAITK